MGIFRFKDDDALGRVFEVDTSTVSIEIDDISILKRMQINRLVALQSSRPGDYLIGIINKIVRLANDRSELIDEEGNLERNLVRIILIGTFIDKQGVSGGIFRRGINTVPEIDANCFAIESDKLTKFMHILSQVTEDENKLSLGVFTLDNNAEAFINCERFFQRHALIVGGIGSGKSWTTAHIIQQLKNNKNFNTILLDLNGEYSTSQCEQVARYKIAGRPDLSKSIEDEIVFLPYWLLDQDELHSLLIDGNFPNASTQITLIGQEVKRAKLEFLKSKVNNISETKILVDDPIPYHLGKLIHRLKSINSAVRYSKNESKSGKYFGMLSDVVFKLEKFCSDSKFSFMFSDDEILMEVDWLARIYDLLLGKNSVEGEENIGVKIFDLSMVPSDILPIAIRLIARMILICQERLIENRGRKTILFCEDAHLYIPNGNHEENTSGISAKIFERIAKEGRKLHLGLVVISQRPSEINPIVLSQCSNIVAMRLTNSDDQSVVQSLIPEDVGKNSDQLSILDIGEAFVFGNSSNFPTRVQVFEPRQKPFDSVM